MSLRGLRGLRDFFFKKENNAATPVIFFSQSLRDYDVELNIYSAVLCHGYKKTGHQAPFLFITGNVVLE
jgi:hypothetical protein